MRVKKRKKKLAKQINDVSARSSVQRAYINSYFSFFLDALQKCVKIVKISALEV